MKLDRDIQYKTHAIRLASLLIGLYAINIHQDRVVSAKLFDLKNTLESGDLSPEQFFDHDFTREQVKEMQKKFSPKGRGLLPTSLLFLAGTGQAAILMHQKNNLTFPYARLLLASSSICILTSLRLYSRHVADNKKTTSTEKAEREFYKPSADEALALFNLHDPKQRKEIPVAATTRILPTLC